MKITKMACLVKGIVDILLSLLIICATIKTHDDVLPRSIIAIILLCFGIFEIVDGIETKAKRLKREEELKVLAELYGLDKKEEENHREVDKTLDISPQIGMGWDKINRLGDYYKEEE